MWKISTLIWIHGVGWLNNALNCFQTTVNDLKVFLRRAYVRNGNQTFMKTIKSGMHDTYTTMGKDDVVPSPELGGIRGVNC